MYFCYSISSQKTDGEQLDSSAMSYLSACATQKITKHPCHLLLNYGLFVQLVMYTVSQKTSHFVKS